MTWYGKQSGQWAVVYDPQVRTSLAWNKIQEGWTRQNGIWQRFFYRDNTPAQAPSVSLVVGDASIQVVVTIDVPGPQPPTRYLTLKVKESTTPAASDGTLLTPLAHVDFDPTVGYTYTWDIVPREGYTYWAAATLFTVYDIPSNEVTATYDVLPASAYHQDYLDAVGGGSYAIAMNPNWYDNDIIQGGNVPSQGCWFYGEHLTKLFGHTVTKMRIQIIRRNTNHGVAGDANVRLGHHDNKNQPLGDPNVREDTKVGTLKRGEKKWFDVPTDWLTAYHNNNTNFRGFGVFSTVTGLVNNDFFISPKIADQPDNGRLYVEWHD